MPLPLILGVGAAIAGAVGVGSGVAGAAKMVEANKTAKEAEARHKANKERFEKQNKTTSKDMDALGTAELEILNSFQEFSNLIEKIQNRPEFATDTIDGVTLPKYDPQKIKEVSVGAAALLGGLGGAAVGTAGGFAAAGATTAAVMALGTASTGTAIASLSGAALTNATLAALGGGAIAAGGGGIALGTAVLGAATLGVGLLVGGAIFNLTGGKLSDQADEAWRQMKKAEEKIDKICTYLIELSCTSKRYLDTLSQVREVYQKHLTFLSYTVDDLHTTDWNEFSPKEKLVTQNTVLLVGLLYHMCQIQIVLKSEDQSADALNTINMQDIDNSISTASHTLEKVNRSEAA